MLKKILLLILIFIIHGCGIYLDGPDAKLSTKNFDEKKSSIVILKIEYGANFDWKSKEDNFLYMGTKINWSKERGFRHESYLTQPGNYYLNRIKFPYPPTTHRAAIERGNTTLESHNQDETIFAVFDSDSNAILKPFSSDGWNKSLQAPNFASFETKAGEIVYIGDLYFTFVKQKYWIRGKINLEVQDNYDEAVKYFREKFPEYKNKPVIKRLAQPGVMLDNYDAGIFW